MTPRWPRTLALLLSLGAAAAHPVGAGAISAAGAAGAGGKPPPRPLAPLAGSPAPGASSSPASPAAAPEAAASGVIRVPQAVPTLQQAIGKVGAGGVIELAAGTYMAPAGGFRIADTGRSFTIRAALGAAAVLGGGGANPVLVLRNSARSRGGLVIFEHLTFRNGGGGGSTTSPGVTVDAGEARFVGCIFSGNNGGPGADGGGAKVRNGSDATFIGCTFTANSSPTAGGALMINDSTVEVLGGTFSGNRVNLPGSDPASHGGAISVVDGSVQISDAVFQGNQAGWVGGAVYAIGSWTAAPAAPAPPATPHSSVSVTRATFQDNAIAPQPCCPPPGDPTGGAIHVEDQTTLAVTGSWFADNVAQFGGAIDSFRALVGVGGSIFQGNRGNVAAADLAAGGAICALSNDSVDSSTAGGQNPRPAAVTVTGSLFEGSDGSQGGSGPAANAGGCILAAGDANHLYGLGGLAPNGTLASNRATVAVSGSVFAGCDIQQGAAGGGTGGAISGSLVALTLDGSLLLDSDAAGSGSIVGGAGGAGGLGGGVYLSGESDAQIAQTTFAGDTAAAAGGALYGTGSNVDISASRFFADEAGPGAAGPLATSRGAALFFQPLGSGQPHAGSGDASGTISGSTFSQNVGLPVWDLDLAGPGPVNTVQYGGNAFYSTTFGDKVYLDTLADPARAGESVAALDSLVVSHDGEPAVVKAPAPNNALSTPPALGSLVAVPPAGAPAARSAPFLAYAWSGTALDGALDGAPLAQHAGLIEGAAPGSHTLTVNGAVVGTATLPAPACTSDPVLCLAGDRFHVQVVWELPTGERGDGHPVALTGDTGYFWFFDPASVELVVKVVDGRALNGDFWVFYGALSNVMYTITVTDTVTGTVNAYVNPQGQLASVADTMAFLGTGEAPPAPAVPAVPPLPPGTGPPSSPPSPQATAGPCAAAPGDLCLQGRFRVDVSWRTATAAGAGTAVPLSGDTGYFWFFDPASVELMVKILDGRALNGDFWVFYGALSDVAYTIKITDTQTGRTKTYTNPQGTLASVADTSALPGP